MIRFESDYLEGAHPRVLELLGQTNFNQTPGYGEDLYCEKARGLIKTLCKDDTIEVQFLVGGTQTNATVIASILRPYQGVISAETGHINVHETGAIEATGHKVLSLPSSDGKITAKGVKILVENHWNDMTHEHMVQPGMVYISNPTENGTLYTKKELEELSEVCHELSLPLYLDGARMGYGLMAEGNDLFLPDITRLCDVFYIGGTKVGALFGEALVITNAAIKKDFRYMIKQHGGMLAKGRLLGLQFIALLEDELYYKISTHANKMAYLIRDAFKEKGYSFLYDSRTNQQFPIVPNEVLKNLEEKYAFSFWKSMEKDHSAVRFCTSWATREEDVEKLIEDLQKIG
ncbi:MAG: low specificity L-threonine aldolase [Clostridiaceae bacterium]